MHVATHMAVAGVLVNHEQGVGVYVLVDEMREGSKIDLDGRLNNYPSAAFNLSNHGLLVCSPSTRGRRGISVLVSLAGLSAYVSGMGIAISARGYLTACGRSTLQGPRPVSV